MKAQIVVLAISLQSFSAYAAGTTKWLFAKPKSCQARVDLCNREAKAAHDSIQAAYCEQQQKSCTAKEELAAKNKPQNTALNANSLQARQPSSSIPPRAENTPSDD